ncbi:MAG: hypothetical protein LUQ50_08235 [Methanospirillum sp.]|uniref:hypothetical protein n=1 Tax=Methanospirillum sp. TaxID=45200 RepID=UPI002373C456|nr:hypothetical protein [Methanospirillum sp.]MDD1729045.1 hypothetical protein [Methanospirillum sp.]
MNRILQVLHSWAGWCPNHGVTLKKKEGNEYMDIVTQMKENGSQDGMRSPAIYSHRQVGIVQIWASIAALAIILGTGYFIPEMLPLFMIVSFILGLSLLLFSTLTVEVRNDIVWILFGPIHLIRRKIPLEFILDFSQVVTPWYYGWGIRYIKNGTLYNISGYEGIEIDMPGKKRIRIGTDDQEGLIEAIEMATGHSAAG